MENEKLQISMAPGAEKAEIIIREVQTVNELPILEPVKINILGTISAVSRWLEKRKIDKEQIDPLSCHVIIDRENTMIRLIINEKNQYLRSTITGAINPHPKFLQFGINTEKTWEPNELGQFFKMNRFYFADKAENMKLVTDLKNFNAKINSTIQKTKEETGSFADNYSGVVTSNLPGSFKLRIPIFKGTPPEDIEVEFYATINGRDVSLALVSAGANQIAEEISDTLIDEQIRSIDALNPEIVIIEV